RGARGRAGALPLMEAAARGAPRAPAPPPRRTRQKGDQPCDPAVAYAFKPAVPTRRRHPDFKLDVRIGSRFYHSSYATERGHVFVERGRSGGRRERSRGNRLCCGDRGVWNLELGELLAVLRQGSF